MATYNGHRNWNHWNVSLWLHNDEHLYYQMRQCVHAHSNLDAAAGELLTMLPKATPDGAPITYTSVRAALSRDC